MVGTSCGWNLIAKFPIMYTPEEKYVRLENMMIHYPEFTEGTEIWGCQSILISCREVITARPRGTLLSVPKIFSVSQNSVS